MTDPRDTSNLDPVAALQSSGYTDWRTPLDLFHELEAEFGPFDLDVAATDENTLCDYYYTREEDGLQQAWFGVCWMNPPYGREVGAWIAKAHEEALAGRATTVCLIPSRTDTAYWHDHVEKADVVRFIRGRVKFVRNGKSGPAPFASTIVVFKVRKGLIE